MKKFFQICVLVLTLCSSSAFAKVAPGNVSLPLFTAQKTDHIQLVINLGDLNQASSIYQKEVVDFIQETLKGVSDSELTCKVTVSGEISIAGYGKLSISVEVSGPCSEIKQKGAEIANMVMDQIKEALK